MKESRSISRSGADGKEIDCLFTMLTKYLASA